MSNQAITGFMRKIGAFPKLRFENNDLKELIFVSVEETEKMSPDGKKKPALKFIVRDRSDGEIKQWITESVTVADNLLHVQPKEAFTVQPTKNGAKKGYQIKILGPVDKGATGDE